MKKNRDNLGQNRIHFHQAENEVIEYRKKEQKHEKKFSPIVILLIIWLLLFFFSLFFVISYDERVFSIAYIFKNATQNMENFYNFLFTAGNIGNIDMTFFKLIGVALTGAALASCGSLMQGSYRNVLAGPSTTGVMAGGNFGCMIYVLFFETAAAGLSSTSFLHTYGYQFCILGGCILGMILILVVTYIAGKGKAAPSAMLIAGMVFSSVISSASMVIQYYIIIKDPTDERIETIRDMMMGSFDRLATWQSLLMMGIPLIVCFVIVVMIRGRLNLLSMGDDEAEVAGMNVRRYRLIMLLLSSVMTALTMAFCGRIGFVGFMVPLITRKITGPDMKRIVPCSMLVGAVLLTLIYDISTVINMDDSINVITSALGCILMAITLLRKGGSDNAFNKGRGQMHMGMR